MNQGNGQVLAQNMNSTSKDQNLPGPTQAGVTNIQNNYQVTRAKSFKVTSASQNYSQYVNTVKAYALAGLPFEHIANAGDILGDLVEREEIDTPLHNLEGKVGEIAEDESKLMAWQSRGETISLTKQLSSGNVITGKEIVGATQSLAVNDSGQQNRDVLEGIAVFNQTPAQIQNPVQTQNSQLENNPYLKAPANLKSS